MLTNNQLGILDIFGDFKNITFDLNISLIDPLDLTKGISLNLDNGDEVLFLEENDIYFRLRSGKYNCEILFYLKSAKSIASAISSPKTCKIYGIRDIQKIQSVWVNIIMINLLEI